MKRDLSQLRIGISMRVVSPINYYEVRDAVARDWPEFMIKVLPEVKWMLIPNIETQTLKFIKDWDLNAFILTGGEDIGTSSDRDNTEKHIYHYAQKHKLPLLGICRGLQTIYVLNNGKISKETDSSVAQHTATRHEIEFLEEKKEVNSYHTNTLTLNGLPNNLKAVGICLTDQTVEAVYGKNLLGLMWHPEREKVLKAWQINLIRDFFTNNNKYE